MKNQLDFKLNENQLLRFTIENRDVNKLRKDVKFSYRIKSLHSCILKYNKYYPSIEVNKCYNDLLGIRVIILDYKEILEQDLKIFRIADMRNGKVNDDDFKQELLQDFDNILNLVTEIGDNYVDNNVIKMLLWIKNNTRLDIMISKLIEMLEEVNEYGYASINDNIIIYKKDTELRDFAKEKLEYMLEDEFYIDKLFTKEVLIEMWRDRTSKDQAIRELIQGFEVEELLDMDIQTIFEDDDNQEYIYAVIDCQ